MKARWLYLAVIFSVLVSTLTTGQFQQADFIAVNVSNSGVACLDEDSCRPSVVAQSGDVFVVWTEEDADGTLSTVRFSRSDNEGDTFTAPTTIAEASGFNPKNVSIDLLANGDLILVWADDRNGNFDIFVTLSNNEGSSWRWDSSNPVLNLTSNEGDSLAPTLDTGNMDTFVVAWSDDSEEDDLNPDGARNIFVRAGRADDASLTETFNVSRGFLSTVRFPADRPALAVNPNRPLRSMFFAWEQEGNRFNDIFFHQTSAFNPINISNSESAQSENVVLAVRNPLNLSDIGIGQQVIAVWQERVSGETQIFLNTAQEGDLVLTDPGFGKASLNLSQAPRSASSPAIAINEANQFFIAWHQEDPDVRNRNIVRLVSVVDVLGLAQEVSSNDENFSFTNVALAADANNVYILLLEKNLSSNTVDVLFTRQEIGNSGL